MKNSELPDLPNAFSFINKLVLDGEFSAIIFQYLDHTNLTNLRMLKLSITSFDAINENQKEILMFLKWSNLNKNLK